jgi:hypothetical protein
VFVRHAKAVWRKATQKEIDDLVGVPLVLQIGGKFTVNPIGKVIKRLQNGDVDYLPFFYTAITSEISRQGRKRPRPPGWR